MKLSRRSFRAPGDCTMGAGLPWPCGVCRAERRPLRDERFSRWPGRFRLAGVIVAGRRIDTPHGPPGLANWCRRLGSWSRGAVRSRRRPSRQPPIRAGLRRPCGSSPRHGGVGIACASGSLPNRLRGRVYSSYLCTYLPPLPLGGALAITFVGGSCQWHSWISGQAVVGDTDRRSAETRQIVMRGLSFGHRLGLPRRYS